MTFDVECQCAGTPLNPGMPGCMPLVGRDKFLIFFDYTDSDGNLNGIPAGTVLDQTYLEGKLNEADPTKRWYVMPEIFGKEAPTPENETEDRDGIPVPTGEEIKQPFTFHHSKEEGNPALKAVYDSIKCRDLGYLSVTYKGQIAGMHDGNGGLIGVHLQKGTLFAGYMEPVKGVLQKMNISFLVDELENDANRDYFPADLIAYPAKNWFADQPIEVVLKIVGDPSTTELVVDARSIFGQAGNKSPIRNLVTADWNGTGAAPSSVRNVTDDADVTITSAESATIPGRYTLTYGVAQDASDVIRVGVTKTGYFARKVEKAIV